MVDVEYRSEPLHLFLEGLPLAVMAVDGEGRVVDGNATFLEMVGKSGSAIIDRLGGEVISCIYSTLPGGCGRTEHCVGCTIRGAVDETRASGQSTVGIPAFAYIRTLDGQVVKLLLKVSTEAVDGLVLLRVDDVTTGPPDGAKIG
jgi:PAS domain-containing protein